jgi:hypothetical protein
MNDILTAPGREIATTRHAFAWVVRSAAEGPIAIPLTNLTQAQWDQLVQRLGRETRRRMRAALEGMT